MVVAKFVSLTTWGAASDGQKYEAMALLVTVVFAMSDPATGPAPPATWYDDILEAWLKLYALYIAVCSMCPRIRTKAVVLRIGPGVFAHEPE